MASATTQNVCWLCVTNVAGERRTRAWIKDLMPANDAIDRGDRIWDFFSNHALALAWVQGRSGTQPSAQQQPTSTTLNSAVPEKTHPLCSKRAAKETSSHNKEGPKQGRKKRSSSDKTPVEKTKKKRKHKAREKPAKDTRPVLQPTEDEKRLYEECFRFGENVLPILQKLGIQLKDRAAGHQYILPAMGNSGGKKIMHDEGLRDYFCKNGFGSLPFDSLASEERELLEWWAKYNHVVANGFFSTDYPAMTEQELVQVLTDDLKLTKENDVYLDDTNECFGSLEDVRARLRRDDPRNIFSRRLLVGETMPAKVANLRVWAARCSAPLPREPTSSGAAKNPRQTVANRKVPMQSITRRVSNDYQPPSGTSVDADDIPIKQEMSEDYTSFESDSDPEDETDKIFKSHESLKAIRIDL